MNHPAEASLPRRPATGALVLAFGLVYLSWGTTFLAIKEGVKNQHLPPALFGGVRVGLAGLLLLGILAGCGVRVRLSRRDLAGVALGGLLFFVGGNGLLTAAERTVPSGVAAVLTATAPLWIGLCEMLGPGGDRPGGRGWLGLVVGLAGVVVLVGPKLPAPDGGLSAAGVLMLLGSACAWALGSVLLRRRRTGADHRTAAAYQMALGGGGLALVGLAVGEAGELTPEHFTAGAVGAFVYLLVVGSLVGFVAYNWLLGHVPASQAGTHAYVNPVVAILVGWLWGNEEITAGIVAGMGIILAGVALVRGGGRPAAERSRPRVGWVEPSEAPVGDWLFRPGGTIESGPGLQSGDRTGIQSNQSRRDG